MVHINDTILTEATVQIPQPVDSITKMTTTKTQTTNGKYCGTTSTYVSIHYKIFLTVALPLDFLSWFSRLTLVDFTRP